jgi:hypothetical protein
MGQRGYPVLDPSDEFKISRLRAFKEKSIDRPSDYYIGTDGKRWESSYGGTF